MTTAQTGTLREALDARAEDLKHLQEAFGLSHTDGIALLQIVWNYDLAMRQLPARSPRLPQQSEEPDAS